MADYLYRAKITHTEKTVEQLYKMQYYVYEKPRMILRALIGCGFAVVTSRPGARRCCFSSARGAGGPGLSGRRAGCHLLKLFAGSADRPLFLSVECGEGVWRYGVPCEDK